MPPTISVVLPVYNCEPFLRESIESILTQEYSDFELIIINDGSTDDSDIIIKKYAISDNRIQYISQIINSGLIECLNLGLSHAKGRYVARMDADDICLPNRFQLQKEFLDSHPEIGVVGSNVHVIDRSGHRISNFINNPRLPETANQIRWALCFSSGLLHPTVMARREILINGGGYNRSAQHAEDYEFWTRLSPTTKYYNLPQKLLLLRRHDTNVTVVHINTTIENSIMISQQYIAVLLNQQIPKKTISYFWENHPSSSEEFSQITFLFEKLIDSVKNKYQLRNSDYFYVTRDATRRLLALTTKIKRLNFIMLCKILLINPLAFFEYILETMIRKLIHSLMHVLE